MATSLRKISFTLAVFIGLTMPSWAKTYEDQSACEKQSYLWSKAVETKYSELPEFNNLGLMQFLAMTFQELSLKTNLESDMAPEGWKKFLHRRGVMAKVKIVSRENNPYSGIFKGAECALLRLSITYNPKDSKPVAPGLALKVLRDGVPSANVSALYTLEGQERDFNFLKHPLSNIVPMGDSIGTKLIHRLFKRVTSYPEQIKIDDMGLINEKGDKTKTLKAPVQLFFVPNSKLTFSSKEHDIRKDFLNLAAGQELYTIYALESLPKNFNYEKYQEKDIKSLVAQSRPIADIITTSEFLSSEFGDEGIFFRHEVWKK